MTNQEFKTKTVEFAGANCTVEIESYTNGQNCLRLVDLEDGMTFCTASVAIDHEMVQIGEDDVIIKNYSENQGILEALFYAGIIGEPHRAFTYNYATFYVCKILK